MKETYKLRAESRTLTGKGGARKVRAAGLCPAVIYGPDMKSRALQVDPKVFQKFLETGGESSLIDLEISSEDGGKETAKVIIRNLSYHPLESTPSHVDFYNVALDREITISVPINLTGSCLAVERKEGTISQQLHEVSVTCLPGNIPHEIEIDISGLEVGRSIHVGDIPPPEGVAIVDSTDLSVVTVTAVKEEVAEEEVAPELGETEPERIGEEEKTGE